MRIDRTFSSAVGAVPSLADEIDKEPRVLVRLPDLLEQLPKPVPVLDVVLHEVPAVVVQLAGLLNRQDGWFEVTSLAEVGMVLKKTAVIR